MRPLDFLLVLLIVSGLGGIVRHHQYVRARRARIRTEADAFERPTKEQD